MVKAGQPECESGHQPDVREGPGVDGYDPRPDLAFPVRSRGSQAGDGCRAGRPWTPSLETVLTP